MGLLSRLFGPFGRAEKRVATGYEEAVILFLDGVGLPDAVYEKHDLGTLEARLSKALARTSAGELDGDEVRLGEVVLFMYGADAEVLFQVIEPIIMKSPLCRNSRLIIRHGLPGADERTVHMP